VTQAAAPQQGVTPAATDEPVLLDQPIRITIRQSIPFTISLLSATEITATDTLTEAELAATEGVTESLVLTATAAAADAVVEEAVVEEAATPAATAVADGAPGLAVADELTATETVTAPVVLSSVPVTLLIELEFVVTQTLTTTIPASVTVQLPDFQTQTVPIEVVIAPLVDGEAVIELVLPDELAATPELTESPTLTATEEITETVVPTPTAEATLAPSINGVQLVNTTVNDIANLRAGPGTTFPVVAQATVGQPVQIAAISVDGGWYLLGTGAWIANFLVADQPANVPVVNDQILQAITGETPAPAEATPDAPAATGVVTPTVTVDANLRAGPGTEFAVLGGTVTGQEINIVGRNADGTWFRLDNDGWVFATLVANPPPPANVPVVNNDGTPVEPPVELPAAAPAPEQTSALGGLLPTPTPQPQPLTQAQSDALNDYLADALGLVGQFDIVLNSIDGLLAEASNNSALLSDAAWTTRINAALTLLRRTSASVGELTVPTGAETIHSQLEAAAISYTQAASALTSAVQAASLAQINEADALISAATAGLTAAESAIIQAQGQ
ncbi:MAG: SH3 domain-containing protein, partial [Caldilinea sp.]